ncbi:nuclear transport factor 2 family protein [Streptomyces caatingaensis]|uniref:SnoaL-like domain-containing protein n=1 Tax=Streptomyces caatingaensis TaxID=1678637 RepID=A0A0K9XCW2_9ACTN|nr:nuclear transport factor 2 family protein [Streptomyces caatingaensis]KNB50492.1 hypothetical protein AC230_21205 [Streptomyces caatingaensis]
MPGIQRHPNVDLAVRYHRAVARGATGADLARFFHPDVVQREFPNALVPEGAVRDLAAILEAAERGRRVLAEQDFEVLDAVAADGRAALELRWRGTLAVPLGGLPAGHRLRARIGVFLVIRDGLIVSQHNYDCYEQPLP